MIGVKVDKSRWERRYRKILGRSAYARRVHTIDAAKLVVRRALATAPRDTQRFVRNLAQAANAAGLGPFPVATTRRTRYYEDYLRRLNSTIETWTWWDQKYQQEGRTGEPYYRKILKRRAQAELELRRFEQTQDAVVIFAKGRNARPTVRWKQYTGRGRIHQTRTQTIVVIHNTEAHASIVEARKKVMRNAISAVKASGGAVAHMSKGKFLKAIGER